MIKITTHQLKVITVAFVCGPTTIIIASSATALARQDAWLSVILSAFPGLIVIWVNTYLGGLYPEMTLAQVIRALLGKWFGGFIILNYVALSLIGTSQLIWYAGDFFVSQYMTSPSPYFINTVFCISIAISVLYGLEAIARASELFYWGIIIMFIVSIVVVSPESQINYLLPILENGFLPVLKGSLPILSFTALPTILLNMVYPANVADVRKAKKSIFLGYLTGMAISLISVLACTLVLGSTISATSRFPVFLLTKEINLGVTFSRLEILIVFTWILTIFNNAVFSLYAGITALADLLKLKDAKKIVIPTALIPCVFSGIIYKDVIYQIKWDTIVWLPYILTYGFVIPLFLLLVHWIKRIAV